MRPDSRSESCNSHAVLRPRPVRLAAAAKERDKRTACQVSCLGKGAFEFIARRQISGVNDLGTGPVEAFYGLGDVRPVVALRQEARCPGLQFAFDFADPQRSVHRLHGYPEVEQSIFQAEISSGRAQRGRNPPKSKVDGTIPMPIGDPTTCKRRECCGGVPLQLGVLRPHVEQVRTAIYGRTRDVRI